MWSVFIERPARERRLRAGACIRLACLSFVSAAVVSCERPPSEQNADRRAGPAAVAGQNPRIDTARTPFIREENTNVVDTTIGGSVHLSIRDTLLVASRGNTRIVTSLRGYMAGAGEYAHRLVDARQKGADHLYLVLQASGLSRPDAPTSVCGGGDEISVIWLELDGTLQLVKGASELTQSCLEDVNPRTESWPGFVGDQWSIVYAVGADSVVRAEYDRRFPERGLRLQRVSGGRK